MGEVLGKYHPHGDAAVYDALVRMVQDFSLRYPLIDGQGNFGSIDGDAPAAMRYTEARLAEIAEEMLADIEKDTVDFVPNFDDSLKEPSVLPAKLPNLLVNGSSGIAVGMATNIPPHNLCEVCDAIALLIDNPDASLEELMEVIKGPDFPTGAYILGREGIIRAYTTGRGTIRLRGRTHIEEGKRRKRIIITEIPYMVNKAKLIESIADLVRNKKIEGITDIRDESDREGMRVVIELRQNASPEVILNQLYKNTQLETTFGIINLVLVDGEPRVLNLRDTILEFIRHRKEVVTRRTRFELARAEKRAHILEGLRIALKNIDAIIKLIRGSPSAAEAKEALMKKFSLTETQAQAILDMRLQKLAKLEREKIEEEYRRLLREIEHLRSLLASEKKILQVVKKETLELKRKYGDERRTEIVAEAGEISIEDLIAREEMVVTITQGGYIKRLPVSTYRQQRRGGRGIVGVEAKEDQVKDIYVASTHDYMLFFSNTGKVYWRKVYEIPTAGRYSRGKAMVNLIEEAANERITATLAVNDFSEERYVFFATKLGKVKKTPLSAFGKPRRGGILAISLAEGDELVEVELTDGRQEILLATRYGKAIRFSEEDVRPMGRTAMGVTGITLRRKDEVVGVEVVKPGTTILAVTENGYGKRTPIEEYPLQRRGGKGVINIIPSVRNGLVVGVLSVVDSDEVVLTSAKGVVIRLKAKEISVMGRNTQGVRLMKLEEGDRVVALAKVRE